MWWLRWWGRAPRSFAEWRSVLLRLRKGVAKTQWACRRRSPCTSSRHGEYSTTLVRHLQGSHVGCFSFALLEFTCTLLLQNILTTFVMWLNLSRLMDAVTEGHNPAPDSLWRRYSEFELLRNYLIVTYPYIVAPPLPEKRVSSVWLRFQNRVQWYSKDAPWIYILQIMSNNVWQA